MKRFNFIDESTGEKFFISRYSTVYSEGSCRYMDKWKKELISPKTGVSLSYIKTEGKIGVPLLSRFNHSTTEGQKNIKAHFGKRANKFDKVGAGRDTRDQKVKDFKSQIMERAKDGRL